MTAGLHFMKSYGGRFVSPTECADRYEDVGHETIIRELTQNALDAATREAEPKRPCELLFEIRRIPTNSIPGVEICQEHLGYMHQWEQIGQQKFEVELNRLRRLYNTNETPEVTCLLARDNGVGLDADRMDKMFGEGDSGKSEKDGASGGTHGVGHKTAFAAGDMNYVLYGGVCRDKSGRAHKTASGHVIFPSHKKQDELFTRWTGDAYLARSLNQPNNKSNVEILNNEREIPILINDELDRIQRKFSTGSIVIIPAFNHFFDEGNVVDLICEDVAKHFFIAIDQGRLSVHVIDYTVTSRSGPVEHTLKSRNDIEAVLTRQHILQDKRRRNPTQIVAGYYSNEAWKTWKENEKHLLNTRFGRVKAYVRYTETGPRRICVVRAGMFITDDDWDMPTGLKRNQFSSRKPFHAILHFADELHTEEVRADQILRDAENKGHSSLRTNKRTGKGKDLKALANELRNALLEILDEIPQNDTFTPDIMPLVISGTVGWRQPSPVTPRPDSPSPDDNGETAVPDDPDDPRPRPPRPPNPRPRKVGRPLQIAASVLPAGPAQVEVEVVGPDRTLPNALVQLQIRTGSDDTCEQPLRGRSIELDLARSLLDGVPLGKGTGTEIPLGRVEAGSRIHLSLQLANGQDTELPMRAVMYRRRR